MFVQGAVGSAAQLPKQVVPPELGEPGEIESVPVIAVKFDLSIWVLHSLVHEPAIDLHTLIVALFAALNENVAGPYPDERVILDNTVTPLTDTET